MIRRPPRSTLFPTRRSSDLAFITRFWKKSKTLPWRSLVPERMVVLMRSEEHTSELQSQSNLVCRLLLEKKKDSTSRNLLYMVLAYVVNVVWLAVHPTCTVIH